MKVNEISNNRVKKLAEWIDSLKEAARKDDQFSISWFEDTKDKPISLVGGWMRGPDVSKQTDLFYVSKSEPDYAMCVKIAENNGPYAYVDFEILAMPVDKNGTVEDTCILLEQNDSSEPLAIFLLHELERITKEQQSLTKA